MSKWTMAEVSIVSRSPRRYASGVKRFRLASCSISLASGSITSVKNCRLATVVSCWLPAIRADGIKNALDVSAQIDATSCRTSSLLTADALPLTWV